MYVREIKIEPNSEYVIQIELKLESVDHVAGYPRGFAFKIPDIVGWHVLPRYVNCRYFTRAQRNADPNQSPYLRVVHMGRWEAILRSDHYPAEKNPVPLKRAIGYLVEVLNRAAENLVD